MKKEIVELPSQHALVENPVRILMVGSINSGKSSFINSLYSTLLRRIVRKINFTASVKPGQSKTKEYRAYQLKLKHEDGKEEKMPVRVCDMPGFTYSAGLEETTTCSINMTDIINTVGGHLKSGHKFTADNHAYDENPKQSKKVHGMCIVLSMSECRDEKVTTQIRTVIERLGTMPRLIILTKIDQCCASIDKIYQNSAVTDAAMNICKTIPSVMLSDIYPVNNYTHEASVDDSLDLLILDAFRTLLNRCMDDIETLQDEDDDD